jgi:hypothetical protein
MSFFSKDGEDGKYNNTPVDEVKNSRKLSSRPESKEEFLYLTGILGKKHSLKRAVLRKY